MKCFYQFANSNVLWMGQVPLNGAGIMQAETQVQNPQTGQNVTVRLNSMTKKYVTYKEITQNESK